MTGCSRSWLTSFWTSGYRLLLPKAQILRKLQIDSYAFPVMIPIITRIYWSPSSHRVIKANLQAKNKNMQSNEGGRLRYLRIDDATIRLPAKFLPRRRKKETPPLKKNIKNENLNKKKNGSDFMVPNWLMSFNFFVTLLSIVPKKD